jgi:hypothetical protein
LVIRHLTIWTATLAVILVAALQASGNSTLFAKSN